MCVSGMEDCVKAYGLCCYDRRFFDPVTKESNTFFETDIKKSDVRAMFEEIDKTVLSVDVAIKASLVSSHVTPPEQGRLLRTRPIQNSHQR